MFNNLLSMFTVIFIALLLVSCQSDSDYDVDFLEINDNNIAIFKIYNNTDSNLMSVNVELTYVDAANKVTKVDTVSYKMVENTDPQYFLMAGEETMISQTVPDNTVDASGKIVSVTTE